MTDLSQLHLISNSSSATMLTKEDVEFINLLIAEQLETFLNANLELLQKPKDYHTVYEIRDLIRQFESAMREWFGSDNFDVQELRGFLKRKTQLRPGDLEKQTANTNRWDSQVSNAVDKNWPDSPILKVAHRTYKMVSHD